MAGPKPLLTEFGIHQRLESCGKECPLLDSNYSIEMFVYILTNFFIYVHNDENPLGRFYHFNNICKSQTIKNCIIHTW